MRSSETIFFTSAPGCAIIIVKLIMRVLDIPRSGKRGNRVWQRNRYCQYSYPAFVPFNPRTPAQVAVRAHFGAVSARWRTLSEAQRQVWMAVASTKKTKPRLMQCGRLPGFNFFVKDQRGAGQSGSGAGGPAAGVSPGVGSGGGQPARRGRFQSAADRPRVVPARPAAA